MSEDWLGCRVSLDCGAKGHLQGTITNIDIGDQTLTVSNFFENGIPSKYPDITINASDIKDLKILATAVEVEKETNENSNNGNSVVHVAKKKAVTRQQSDVAASNNNHNVKPQAAASHQANSKQQEKAAAGPKNKDNEGTGKPLPLMALMGQHRPSRRSPHNRASPKRFNQDDGYRGRSGNELGGGSRAPNRAERIRAKNEDCFSPSVHDMADEFDFEKNLALFDKESIFSEINQDLANRPDIVRLVDCNRKPQEPKYKTDENVLGSIAVEYRQISTGEIPPVEYVTDSDLVVPAISLPLRQKLFEAFDNYGFGPEKQSELMGRAATELALQALGGQHRLAVTNSHQLPLTVVLCGTTATGAHGICAARHLASHGVRTIVYLPEQFLYPHRIETELRLYRLTGEKLITNAKDLPKSSVDMIITAMEDQEMYNQDRQQTWYKEAVAWASSFRSPVLAMDPAPENPVLSPRITLVYGLPLAHTPASGKLHLANLAVPKRIFKEVGITYAPPFGAKYVIPLHFQ